MRRLEVGEPPSESAEHDWYRMERERIRRQEEAIQRRQRKQEEAANGSGQMPAQITRTTAEPRPNAYIPDDLGIPKPYGGLGLFKPTEPGASMRHIRKPQPKEIEI